MKEHIPVRIYFRANGEANSYSLINQADNKWMLALLVNGEHTTARQAEILEEMQRRWNAHDDLVSALEAYNRKHRRTYGLDGAWDEEITMAERALANATGSNA